MLVATGSRDIVEDTSKRDVYWGANRTKENPGELVGQTPCTDALDSHAWPMHDLCMATKTISIEIDAYELLVREKRDPKESFSRVIRRVLSERPALTAGDLLAAMQAFEGKGAGARRRRDRNAAA